MTSNPEQARSPVARELKCAGCRQHGRWTKTRWIPYEGTTAPFCDACDKVAEGWSSRVRSTAEEHAAFRAARNLRVTRLAGLRDEQMRITLDERLGELVEAQMTDRRYAHGLERWSSTAGRHLPNRAAHERVTARTREWLEHFGARWSTHRTAQRQRSLARCRTRERRALTVCGRTESKMATHMTKRTDLQQSAALAMVRSAGMTYIQVADPGDYDEEVRVRIGKREALRLCADAGEPAHWIVAVDNCGDATLIRLNGERIGHDDS